MKEGEPYKKWKQVDRKSIKFKQNVDNKAGKESIFINKRKTQINKVNKT